MDEQALPWPAHFIKLTGRIFEKDLEKLWRNLLLISGSRRRYMIEIRWAQLEDIQELG